MIMRSLAVEIDVAEFEVASRNFHEHAIQHKTGWEIANRREYQSAALSTLRISAIPVCL